MFGDEVFNLKRLPLCASPLRVEKQNLSWVTGISVSRESTGGKLVQFSFEDNLLIVEQECFPLAVEAINLQKQTGQLVKCQSVPLG